MEVRKRSFVNGLILLMCAVFAITAAAQTSTTNESAHKTVHKADGTPTFHLSEVRGPIRPVDLSPLGKEVSSEVVGGPANGSDNAYLIYTRMPAGTHGPAMFTLAVDDLYLVLSGKLNVQIGTDKFVAAPDTAVFVPAGIPHEVWNAGSEPEANIEVICPAPSRDLMSMMRPAQPRKIENTAQYIHPAQTLGSLGPGLNSQPLVSRTNGSQYAAMRIDNVAAGSGGPAMHIHAFEQVYFVKEGTMTFQYGSDRPKVQANSFVIIPPATVHTNSNDGPGVERHVTLLLPQPEPGTQADIPVELKPRTPPGQ